MLVNTEISTIYIWLYLHIETDGKYILLQIHTIQLVERVDIMLNIIHILISSIKEYYLTLLLTDLIDLESEPDLDKILRH